MEVVRNPPTKEVSEIVAPTIGDFFPLLEAKRAEIESVKKDTFKYGETERHKVQS